jgi:hypothetical protein
MDYNNRLETIWGYHLLDEGFTSFPNLLIRNYRRLGVEHGEWSFICALLTHKHDHRDPYPSRQKLAEYLNCSERQIDKWVQSLRKKGLLKIGERRNPHNKRWGNTVYSIKPLIDACLALVGKNASSTSEDEYEITWEENPGPEVRMGSGPEVRMGSGPEVRMGSGPEVRTKITTRKQKDKKKKENNNDEKNVVVVPDSIKTFCSEKGIPVSDETIHTWLELADENVIIQALNDTISRPRVKNVVGYVTGILRKGYTPSVQTKGMEDKLPESVLWQQELEKAEKEAAAAGEVKSSIEDDPELKSMLQELRKAKG